MKYLIGVFLRIWETRHPICGQVKIPFTLTLALHTERLLASGSLTIRGLDARGNSPPGRVERERIGTALWALETSFLGKGAHGDPVRSSWLLPGRLGVHHGRGLQSGSVR